MTNIRRQAKSLLDQKTEMDWLVDFAKLRKGQILTFIPSQNISTINIMRFGKSEKPIAYKAVVKDFTEDTFTCQVMTAPFTTIKVVCDRKNGFVKDGVLGQMINKRFKEDTIFILQSINEWLDYKMILTLIVLLHRKAEQLTKT